jgi:hypothetical protein
MNHLARLGNQVSHPLALAPVPLKYRLGIPAMLLLVLLAAVGGAWMLVEEHLVAARNAILVAIGLILAAVAGRLLRYRHRHFALTLYEKGISIRRPGRTQIFLFDEIRQISLRRREQLSNGVRYGLLRRVTLRSATDRAAFEAFTLDSQRDTAGAFLDTVRACIADAAGKRLRDGGFIAGKGWSLREEGLQISGRAAPVSLPSLSQVALFGKRVAVWKDEEETPCFSVADDSPNAMLLLDYLAKRLPDRRQHAGGLGRVLLEKRPRWSVAVLLGLTAAGAFAVAAALVSGELEAAELAAVAVAIGLLLAGGAFMMATSGFRCHERGIVKFSPFGRRELRYSEIGGLSYQATRHYYNGIYTGTSLEAKFFPEGGGSPLGVSARAKGSEQALDLLREQVAGLIAAKLRDRLSRQEEVPWTDGARLSRRGVRFPRRKLLGRGAEAFAAFADGLRYSIDQGFFHLFVPGEKKRVLTLPCGGTNFYPGLLLFGQLAAEAAAPGSSAAPGGRG